MPGALRRYLCWLVLVGASVSACADATADPCAGEPDECRQAMELAMERLGPGGRDRVRQLEVRAEHDCSLIDPTGTRSCPGEVAYAARVTLDMQHDERFPVINMVVAQFGGAGMMVMWDDRHPGQ